MRIGRVVRQLGDRFVVECLDGEAVRVLGPAQPGDWVRLHGVRDGSDGWREADRAEVIAPSRNTDFPSPRGEWFRLRDHQGRRLANLRRRAAALAAVRRFFEQHEFLEIEAPLMVPSPGLELHLDAYAVEHRYLITSPEYQLKRLLAAGLPRIWSHCRCFRRGEAGPHHNPEFSMIEFYRAPGTWEEIARDVERLVAHVVHALHGGLAITYRGQALDFTPPWQWLSVREAMAQNARVELDGDETAEALAARARAAGFHVPDGTRWDDAFFSVFLEAVEPALGVGKPTILFDWPAPLAALARRSSADPRVVERFEAYAGGLELCNGFGELTDPVEQRARLEKDAAERRARGLPVYPIDEKFLAALEEGLPPSGGVAVGFDRLVMLACDAATIREVSAFTIDEL